jgi:hypothetical protein
MVNCLKDTKFKIINQYRNATCHMQSLETDFYFSAFNSFDYVCTQVCAFGTWVKTWSKEPPKWMDIP